jgi:hypothetical protein
VAFQADSVDIEAFVRDGYLHLPGAFPRDVADAGRALLWQRSGARPDERASWTRPVVRLDGYGDEPFRAAANTPGLHAAFDALAGAGRWIPRTGLGTFPLRFPHPDDPGDDGWHVEGSFAGPSGYRTNLVSRGRALLMLFLFSDVGPEDAPTRIRVGSHLDVPPLLAPAGEEGLDFMALARVAVPASEHRPVAYATGAAGDVYLCHPFLVHAAQPHTGRVPRFMAQPPLEPTGVLDLERASTPVERAVVLGLATANAGRPTE